MNVKELRSKAIEFCIKVSKSATPRANLIKQKDKEVEVKLSEKASKIKKIIDTGAFGYNTKAVNSLVNILLGEEIKTTYEHEHNEDDDIGIFENMDRKKKFPSFSVIECGNEYFYSCTFNVNEIILIIGNDIVTYDSSSYNLSNETDDFFNYFEICNEDQIKKFINTLSSNVIKKYFSFLEFV